MSETAIDHGAQQRALWLSTIAFTACFAVWMIFAIIGIQIKSELSLSETQGRVPASGVGGREPAAREARSS